MELDTLGDEKTALFLIMSDTDASFNFLISMIYSQLFNLLCEKADDVYGGRLPVHVRCLIDECANIGQIPNLEKLVATIRSREISACLVLQAQSQLKAIYKDNADTIIGNMDSLIFLGGKEKSTLKEMAETLGKETIDTFNTGESRGREVSHSLNYQKLGKELMSVDELAVMDGGMCILQLRGVRPFLSRKYDITKHPNYRYLSDADPRNAFNIERYLSTRLKLKASDTYETFEAKVGEEDEIDPDVYPQFAIQIICLCCFTGVNIGADDDVCQQHPCVITPEDHIPESAISNVQGNRVLRILHDLLQRTAIQLAVDFSKDHPFMMLEDVVLHGLHPGNNHGFLLL